MKAKKKKRKVFFAYRKKRGTQLVFFHGFVGFGRAPSLSAGFLQGTCVSLPGIGVKGAVEHLRMAYSLQETVLYSPAKIGKMEASFFSRLFCLRF